MLPAIMLVFHFVPMLSVKGFACKLHFLHMRDGTVSSLNLSAVQQGCWV